MARINLLPWREDRRKLRQNEFYAILVAAALAGLLVFAAIWYQHKLWIDGQIARNSYLKGEISALDEKIKEIEALEKTRSQLLARKAVIEQLQASRSKMVHLFDDLVRTIPEGVRLMAIKQDGEQLTLEGVADSNARVSTYMRNLEISEWVSNPQLAIVEARGTDKRSRYAFTVRVDLKKTAAEAAAAEEAAAAPPPPQGAAP